MTPIGLEKANKQLPVNLWDRVEVQVGPEGAQGKYLSRVEDFTREGIIIAQPHFIGGGKLLTADSQVYVQFAKTDALYRFSAKIKMIPNNPTGQILLHNLGSAERVQRRQFVRVDMHLDLKYAFLKHFPSAIKWDELRWYPSCSANISGGGLLMRSDDNIQKDDLLMIRIAKYESLGIPRLLSAICCRIIRMDDEKYAGMEFILDRELKKYLSPEEINLLPSQIRGFNSNVQNRLVKFVFEQQVKDRQKGLI
jgi:c-di-GMP-binding flagellar brake protein YcgR